MAEGVERFSIQYSNERTEMLESSYTTKDKSTLISQAEICIGSSGYPNNDSIGSAAGNTLDFASKKAILECIEHFHIKNSGEYFTELAAHAIPPLFELNVWLESQFRKLSIQIYRPSRAYSIARCVCSDRDNGRSTVGTASALTIEEAIFKAAAESIVFWRNMISLENNCVNTDSLTKEERYAIMSYRGALPKDAFNISAALKVTEYNNEEPYESSVNDLLVHLAELHGSDVSLYELTDPILSIPVVKVHIHSQ